MSHRSTGFTRKQRISAAVLAVALMLTMALPAVAAPAGPAALVLIDHFDAPQAELIVSFGTSTLSSSAPGILAGPILGNERDLQITWLSAPSNSGTASVQVPATSNLNHSQQVDVVAKTNIQWDGEDGSPNVSTQGLCAGTPSVPALPCANLTQSGGTQFRVGVSAADRPAILTFTVYAFDGSIGSLAVNVPIQPVGITEYYYWPFASFPNLSLTDFQEVRAIELLIEGSASADISLHLVEVDDGFFDWGDLPDAGAGTPSVDNYPTTLAQNGPRHNPGNLWLGTLIDTELDGQQSMGANGDDNNPANADDEDGIDRTPGKKWRIGPPGAATGGSLDIVVAGPVGGKACLAGWVDWNNNGSFGDFGEKILANQLVNVGTTNNLQFGLGNDSGNVQADVYARFRLYAPDLDAQGNPECRESTIRQPTGPAENGEVEDYRWTFGPNAVTLSGMTASPAATPLALPLGIVTFLGVLVGGIVLARRPI